MNCFRMAFTKSSMSSFYFLRALTYSSSLSFSCDMNCFISSSLLTIICLHASFWTSMSWNDNCYFKYKTYLCQLFTVFFFFQLLPSPVNLNVLLVTRNHFCVDPGVAFFPQFLFLDASLVFYHICVRSDLRDNLRSLTVNLLQETYRQQLDQLLSSQ